MKSLKAKKSWNKNYVLKNSFSYTIRCTTGVQAGRYPSRILRRTDIPPKIQLKLDWCPLATWPTELPSRLKRDDIDKWQPLDLEPKHTYCLDSQNSYQKVPKANHWHHPGQRQMRCEANTMQSCFPSTW